MVHEINASAIIALLAQKSTEKEIEINLNQVISIGSKVEMKHPSVFVDTDKYSFHSFARISSKSIRLERTKIVIDKTDHVLIGKLNRMLPTEIVCKYIEEVI